MFLNLVGQHVIVYSCLIVYIAIYIIALFIILFTHTGQHLRDFALYRRTWIGGDLCLTL